MKIFLIGYYGFGNCGDSVCLFKSQQIIKNVYESAVISILHRSNDSQKKYVNRSNFFTIVKTIWQTDLVVFGGGSLLQNLSSSLSLYYYLTLIWISKCFGKKVIFLGQGLGPIRGFIHQFFVESTLKLIAGGTFRDIESYSFVARKQFTCSSDLAFYDSEPLFKEGAVDVANVGISYSSRVGKKQIVDVTKILNDHHFNLQGYSFFSLSDNDFFHRCQVNFQEINTVKDFYSEPNGCELNFFIGMRLHSCIWAALRGIPFVSISEDPKCISFAKSMNQLFIFNLGDDFEKKLVEICLKLTQHREKYVSYIHQGVADQILLSQKHGHVFA